MRLITVALAVLVLAGCATRYPESLRTEAAELVPFTQAQRNPEQYEGQTARWGGVIANVSNQQNQTRIEVVSFGLNRYGRPHGSDQTPGRFYLYMDEFVDPEVFNRGRMISAVGTFSGVEEGQIGDFVYHYPVLQADGIELWRQQSSGASHVHMGYYYDPHSLWYRNHLYGVGPYRYYYPPYPYRPGYRVRYVPPREQTRPPRRQRPSMSYEEFQRQGVRQPPREEQ